MVLSTYKGHHAEYVMALDASLQDVLRDEAQYNCDKAHSHQNNVGDN